MNDPADFSNREGFDSRDCEFVISDGPGDTTVRPCRASLRKIAEAEREKIARWSKPNGQEPPPADGPENSSETGAR